MNFAVTCGDINGVGPEIAIKAFAYFLSSKLNPKFYFFSPKEVFEFYYQQQFRTFNYEIVDSISEASSNSNIISVIDLGKTEIALGKVTLESGKVSFLSIKYAFKAVKSKTCDALITAPISKSAIKLAGHHFPGHTELLAQWCECGSDFVMMFLSTSMKAALLTIHEPLGEVSKLLTTSLFDTKIRVLNNALVKDLGIKSPKIALLGLNPHAGEDGNIGEEEELLIKPWIAEQKGKYKIDGPFPADGFFGSLKYKSYDLIVGCYHDQILIPFKLLHSKDGVNYTAGLPILRTSPDHGCAFDIAGLNAADSESFINAIRYAKIIYDIRSKGAAAAYSVFSDFYNDYTKSVKVSKFVSNLNTKVTEILGRAPKKVLELASGTGKFAESYKPHCGSLIISDSAIRMLENSNYDGIKLCFDMSLIPLKTKFDLVLSFFDSVNYLLSKELLLRLFKEIHRILDNNGIFIFDVALEETAIEFANMSHVAKNYTIIPNYNKKTKIIENEIKVTDKNGIIHTEIHRQKIYEFSTIFDCIDRSGLFVLECKNFSLYDGDWSKKDASSNSKRVIFIVKKKNNVKST